jgi:Flp pilus assembly protein TadD
MMAVRYYSRILPLVLPLVLTSCAQRSAALHPAAPVVTAMDRQIRNAVDAGDGDYLLRAMRQRVMEHPDDLPARLELGHAYENRSYPELALEHYRLAAERFPESAEAHLQLARSLHAARLTADASRTFGDFLQAHPQRSVAYASWLGILRDDAGDWKSGETAHREAIEIALSEGQDKDYLHNNLGYCLLRQGRKAEAAAEFRSALALNQASEIARDNLGIAIADDSQAAILHWQSVSEPASAHSNMAAMLIEQRKYPEARAEIVRALGYNRTHSAALANLKLVSELDGKPAIVPVAASPKGWTARWKVAVKQWFAVPAKPEVASTIQTAAR